MRIVLDTTILVRANQNTQGLGRQLLLRVIEHRHTLLVSDELLYELARVLRYPRLQAAYGLSEEKVYEFIGFLREVPHVVTLDPFVLVPIRDINDIAILQTAVIGEADVLCTTDDDFYDAETAGFLNKLGIHLLGDIDLMHLLRF